MFDKQSFKRLAAMAFAAMLAACAAGSSLAPERAPQGGGEAMATAANPHAVEAALTMLRAGGSAVDAAIAAELVLGLVEPQSSGIGGGGFLLFYDARSERISAYDGRERAPAGARATMFLNNRGEPIPFADAVASGLSTGAPSLVAMLRMAHEDHGKLPWAQLFAPAIALADGGFEVSPRMARAIASNEARLRADFGTRGYFFDAQNRPLQAGHLLRNPQYAETLRAIAAQGPRALSEGPIAEQIVAAVRRNPRGGSMTLDDLRAVAPRRVDATCGAFRVYRVCSMGPPSSGGAMIEILGLYERARPEPEGPRNADDWAAFLWASRLAYADRDHYVADDRFAPVPTQEMLSDDYLDERAGRINLSGAAPRIVPAGQPAGPELFEQWGRVADEESGTTHLSIVDQWGNAVALTATVESGFGSKRMVAGFMLNNQLTDFSLAPTLNGRPVANAVEPGKAPRSSMSPTIVTDRNGELVLVIGSPGGSSIVGYVARTTIGILDWDLPVQDAINIGNVVARTEPARIEGARMPPGVVAALQARGWTVDENASEESGLHAIRVTPQGLQGGADPRREGVVGRIPATAPTR
jgi:gamma-glutamyltranspeptidase/glutathione hydrolase